MQKIPRAQASAEKSYDSSGPPRAKPTPRHLVRTVYQVAITHHGKRADLSLILALEAGQKLSPRRFFALLSVVLGEG